MPGMALVAEWVKTYRGEGRSKADALRDLNASLGTKYDSSHLSRWERGEREPGQAARHQMMLRVLPAIMLGATKSEIRDAAEMLR